LTQKEGQQQQQQLDQTATHTQATMSLYTNQPNRMNPYDVDDGDDSIPPASGLTLTSKPAAATAIFPASSSSSSSGVGRTTFT
jgi:hypothetical protein